jgi:hypothetical protein
MLQRAGEASARERAAIAEEREAVDRGRADWEAEVARMTAVHPSSEERFKLNVGGVRFDTSRTTLTKVPESILAAMFGARVDMLRRDPEDGSVFLDRDGGRFSLVGDFLDNVDELSRQADTLQGPFLPRHPPPPSPSSSPSAGPSPPTAPRQTLLPEQQQMLSSVSPPPQFPSARPSYEQYS